MSDKNSFSDIETHDVLIAFSLLSRLPVPNDHARTADRVAKAAWAYPFVGAGLGALAGLVGIVFGWFGVPAGMLAALVLATLAILSGAMHEDGLADFADGVGASNDKSRILEIMRDSRIGAYGTIALIIAILARWSGIGGLTGWYSLIFGLMAAGAVSRAVMVLVMYYLPNASNDGMSANAGRPDITATLLAIAISLIFAFLAAGFAGILLLPVALLGALPVYFLANLKLGGQTGDVLGAIQQTAEIAALAALVAVI